MPDPHDWAGSVAEPITPEQLAAALHTLMERPEYTQTPHEARIAEVNRLKADLWLSRPGVTDA